MQKKAASFTSETEKKNAAEIETNDSSFLDSLMEFFVWNHDSSPSVMLWVSIIAILTLCLVVLFLHRRMKGKKQL